MKTISIDTEYITMSQFLKLADCISSGGQAKIFLAQEHVLVNGAIENRRGKKLYPGDTVQIEGIGEFRITRP